MAQKPVLGYWDLRGLGSQIRMLLHYAGVDFVDKRYKESESHLWFAQDKVNMEKDKTLDFPNIPYYIDGDTKLSHTRAIMAHIGRKYGLEGETDDEINRMHMAIEQASDMRNAVRQFAYLPKLVSNFDEVVTSLRKEYVRSLPSRLQLMANFLGSRQWVAGSRVTYADFYVYEILDYQRILFKGDHLAQFPTLVSYLRRFEALNGVKEYLNSSSFSPLPTHASFATIGNTKDFTPLD